MDASSFTPKIVMLLLCLGIALAVALPARPADKPNYVPKDGYVPDKETAIAIAIAVWTPIYGKKMIEDEKPYVAKLINDVWLVTGSLPPPPKGLIAAGGVAEIEIAKQSGCILRVIHGE